MRFNIKEIGDDGLSINVPVTPAWLATECPDLDAELGPGGLRVRGQLLRSEDDIFLRGTLRGVMRATCSRCLEPALVPIDVPLMVTFVSPSTTDDEDDEEKEDHVAFLDGNDVDIGPEVRDQVLLALPIARLCREDCAGLCAVCGGNRNEVACNCVAEQAQSRVQLAAVLGKLKIQ